MPAFNTAEGKLSIHHSLKIKSKYTAAEESEGYSKGMGIQSMATGGHTGMHARKHYLREGRKDKGKVQSLRK